MGQWIGAEIMEQQQLMMCLHDYAHLSRMASAIGGVFYCLNGIKKTNQSALFCCALGTGLCVMPYLAREFLLS